MNQRLFVIWRYDLYPYCLGAELLEMSDKGSVKAKGYSGMWFKRESIIAILPFDKGHEIYQKIEALRSEYRKATSQLHDEYLDKANAILPGVKEATQPHD